MLVETSDTADVEIDKNKYDAEFDEAATDVVSADVGDEEFCDVFSCQTPETK